MPDRRILIIGGSGFVGAKLAKWLALNGYTVAITYVTHPLDLGTHAYRVDLLSDWESLHRCIAEFVPDMVVHCAIPKMDSSAAHHRVSVQSMDYILPHLHPNTLVIYFSTNAVFNDGGPHNEVAAPKLRGDRYSVYGETRA